MIVATYIVLLAVLTWALIRFAPDPVDVATVKDFEKAREALAVKK